MTRKIKIILSKRDVYLRKTYGITLLQYEELLKKQGGVCAVCQRPPKDGKNLSVDHNHESMEIRGLLDFYCNRKIIGRHKKPDLLLAAAKYLSQGTGWFVPKKKKKKKRRKKCHTR